MSQSIFEGRKCQLRAFTFTHGPVRLALEDTLELGEKITRKTLNEFDNDYPGLVFSTYEGVTGKISFAIPNDVKNLALVMDADPAATRLFYDPAIKVRKTFHVAGNIKDLQDISRACFVVANCVPGASPLSMPVVDAAKSDIEWEATKIQLVRSNPNTQVAMLYTRVKAYGSSAYAWTGTDALGVGYTSSGDLVFSGSGPYTFTLGKAAVVVPDGSARTYMLALLNGIEQTSGFTITGVSGSVTATPGATDVWEFFTLYDPAI